MKPYNRTHWVETIEENQECTWLQLGFFCIVTVIIFVEDFLNGR